jgi:hypothetical protein
MVVDVYADIASGATGNYYTVSLGVSGQTAQSNTAVSVNPVTGQQVTIGTVSISAALDSSTPDNQLVVANKTNVLVAKYKFEANNDTQVKDVYIKLVDPNADRTVIGAKLDLNNDGTPDVPVGGVVYRVFQAYTNGTTTNGAKTIDVPSGKGNEFTVDDYVVIYDGSTYDIRQVTGVADAQITVSGSNFSSAKSVQLGAYTYAFTGVNLQVTKNVPVKVGVYLDLNDVTTNGQSGDSAKVALIAYKYSVSGVDTLVYPATNEFTGLPANEALVRRTVPTVVKSSTQPSSTLYPGQGTEVLYIDVKADPAYDVQVRSISFKPVISGTITGGDGIHVYVDNVEKGSALNQSSSGATVTTTNCSNITTVTLTTSTEATKFQIGEKIALESCTFTIAGINGSQLTVTPPSSGTLSTTTVTVNPAGYTSGNTYKVALNNLVIPAGQTKTLVVKADTSGLSNAGNSIQFNVDADTSLVTDGTGKFVWTDGQVININGYLVKSLPITGNPIVKQ